MPNSNSLFYTTRMPYEFKLDEVIATINPVQYVLTALDVHGSGKSIFKKPMLIEAEKTKGSEKSDVFLKDDEEIQLFLSAKDIPIDGTKIQVIFKGKKRLFIAASHKSFARDMRNAHEKKFKTLK